MRSGSHVMTLVQTSIDSPFRDGLHHSYFGSSEPKGCVDALPLLHPHWRQLETHSRGACFARPLYWWRRWANTCKGRGAGSSIRRRRLTRRRGGTAERSHLEPPGTPQEPRTRDAKPQRGPQQRHLPARWMPLAASPYPHPRAFWLDKTTSTTPFFPRPLINILPLHWAERPEKLVTG